MSCKEVRLAKIGCDVIYNTAQNSRFYQISKNTIQVFGGINTEKGIDLGRGVILPYGHWYRFNNGNLEIYKDLPVS